MMIKSRFRLVATLAATVAAGLVACGKPPPSTADYEVGVLGLQLTGGVQIGSVSYDITGNGFHKSGATNVANSSTVSLVINGIPVGNGFTIALSASDATDSRTTCQGSATFNIAAGSVATVVVHLRCQVATKTGSVMVNGSLNLCPTIGSLAASPAEVAVGYPLALSSDAADTDHAPSALSYSWSTTSGTLSSATAEAPTLTCAVAGPATVTLTVSDGDCAKTDTIVVTCSAVPVAGSVAQVKRVLLLSIDGLHQQDLANFVATHPDSTLAALSKTGLTYTNAWVNRLDGTATNPSDSFPGLLALTTGGSSPTHGGWYDVSYARDLYSDSSCTTPGTAVEYDEFAELDNSGLWGNGTLAGPTHDVAVVRSRLTNLPYRKTLAGCSPVFPHNFIRVNTIFEVAHEAGLHTAWSDKHLAYELVTGPSGAGLDDFFAPEINSLATNLPGTGAAAGDDFTRLYTFTQIYDDFKAHAILNQIDGKWSDDGLAGATDTATAPGVPAIFGMNFQAVSVAQKDARPGEGGGYLDAFATPDLGTANAMAHTDATIGQFVAELKAQGLLASTLVVISAKHGQSPIDSGIVKKRDGDAIAALIDAVAPLAGHIEDDVGLYWLKDPWQAGVAAQALLAAPSDGSVNDPSIDTVYTAATPGFRTMFGDPSTDPHTPDLVVTLKKGTIYSLSAKKRSEHGGFADDDAHVGLLVSNPSLAATTIAVEVRTKQVAPTILKALGLDPTKLQAVAQEGTSPLPGVAYPNISAWSPLRWTVPATPTPVTINGGPWSLAQLAPGTPVPPPVGTTLTNVSFDYCIGGVRQSNAGVASMQPYYFPMVIGSGNTLQGFFDWRPKDINEAVVAAKSTDGGLTWTFQQDAFTLTEACPTDQTKTNPDAVAADNGFGHPYVFEAGGASHLYVLDRSGASIDNLGLVVTTLSNGRAALEAQPAMPLSPAPKDSAGATLTRTVGLINPDGILGVVPGSSPVQVLYISKLKDADNSGATAMPLAQQCKAQPYLQPGQTTARKANHDIVTARLASTVDGVTFTDLGAVSGLNDPTTVSILGTRYISPNGAILKLDGTHYGLFFAGGNCIDADSDGFHYIGYAESTDLIHWTIVNGLNNPIASLATIVLPEGGTNITIPAQTPLAGQAQAWWKARVYAPSVVKFDDASVTLTFAGYGIQSPNNGLLHYRQIGHAHLNASRALP